MIPDSFLINLTTHDWLHLVCAGVLLAAGPSLTRLFSGLMGFLVGGAIGYYGASFWIAGNELSTQLAISFVSALLMTSLFKSKNGHASKLSMIVLSSLTIFYAIGLDSVFGAVDIAQNFRIMASLTISLVSARAALLISAVIFIGSALSLTGFYLVAVAGFCASTMGFLWSRAGSE